VRSIASSVVQEYPEPVAGTPEESRPGESARSVDMRTSRICSRWVPVPAPISIDVPRISP
jgi:hypothetical protein